MYHTSKTFLQYIFNRLWGRKGFYKEGSENLALSECWRVIKKTEVIFGFSSFKYIRTTLPWVQENVPKWIAGITKRRQISSFSRAKVAFSEKWKMKGKNEGHFWTQRLKIYESSIISYMRKILPTWCGGQQSQKHQKCPFSAQDWRAMHKNGGHIRIQRLKIHSNHLITTGRLFF